MVSVTIQIFICATTNILSLFNVLFFAIFFTIFLCGILSPNALGVVLVLIKVKYMIHHSKTNLFIYMMEQSKLLFFFWQVFIWTNVFNFYCLTAFHSSSLHFILGFKILGSHYIEEQLLTYKARPNLTLYY